VGGTYLLYERLLWILGIVLGFPLTAFYVIVLVQFLYLGLLVVVLVFVVVVVVVVVVVFVVVVVVVVVVAFCLYNKSFHRHQCLRRARPVAAGIEFA
jgi:hypothetical protein